MKSREEILKKVKRIVVKIGTGLLTDDHNQLNLQRIEALASQVVNLRTLGKEIIIVSSGSIGAGMGTLGIKARPKKLPTLQACAAIGQSKLMAVYADVFQRSDVIVGQVLLIHDDLRSRVRHLNARHTLQALLESDVLPIINENDTVAVDEIRFGDNDFLGALAATLIDADLYVILSHVEGLLSRGSKEPLPVVSEITHEIEQLAGGTNRSTSVGGMTSKIQAAKVVMRAGIPMMIANGERPSVLSELIKGEEIGTLFLPRGKRLASRKRWIAFFQRPVGTMKVDDGARVALVTSGKSLLTRGVIEVEGNFRDGDVIRICDPHGVEFARGISRVGMEDINKANGVVVHCDDLVIL